MCGIFAVANHPEAARLASLGLFALQHRGQESAGLAVLRETGQLEPRRGRGLVAEIFSDAALAALPGRNAIGHVRYSTAGGSADANIQPFLSRVAGQPLALAHNGNISNAEELTTVLETEGAIFHGTSDSELFLHLAARRSDESLAARLAAAAERLAGAYSVVVLTNTHLFGLVDPRGYRPLCLGRIGRGDETSWILASESCALDLAGAEFVRDVAPGELLSIELATGRQESLFLRAEMGRHCAFEHIYFARPDSRIWGASTEHTRVALGRALAVEQPAAADVVIGIPDSGLSHALGFAERSGIPYKVGLIRNHYVGRTFIEPGQERRHLRVRMKLNPVRDTVRGKRVVVVDDSLVRGTTARSLMELLRDAGALEIHLRLGSPPVRFPCFYGIDTPTHGELLAHANPLEAMREALGVDSLGFLSRDALVGILGKESCTSCFDGQYQDAWAQTMGNPK